MPTIVAFFAVMGRICGALARTSPADGAPPAGRTAGAIARGAAAGDGAGEGAGAGAAGAPGFRTLAAAGGGAATTGLRADGGCGCGCAGRLVRDGGGLTATIGIGADGFLEETAGGALAELGMGMEAEPMGGTEPTPFFDDVAAAAFHCWPSFDAIGPFFWPLNAN